ncbi:MAG TPA: DUF2867 domain-containing protein [Rhodocyclaceae bacterium]|nr:DUF2867 domain-containing protein [Rhodocyclaceae bacterium]
MHDHIAETSLLTSGIPEGAYQDSFTVQLPAGPYSPEQVVSAFFQATPSWLRRLMTLRNLLVKHLGLKTGGHPAAPPQPPFAVGQQIGVFRLYAINDREAVLGEDDRHLDFRVSLLLSGVPHRPRLAVSTWVKTHNPLGRGYFALIRPFHRWIVPIMTRATARRLCALEQQP